LSTEAYPAPEHAVGPEDEWSVYDRPAVQKGFVHDAGGGESEAALLLEGVHCAACVQTIQRAFHDFPIHDIQVNPVTARARVRWRGSDISLSSIMRRLAETGYRPHLLETAQLETVALRQRRQALKRLVVAGIGMMQVMMYAVGLYAGVFEGMDPTTRDFLRWVSMLVATPVVLYSGRVFFTGAWRELRNRRPGMDVPVALAIGAAYLASIWITINGGEEVYFDSVTMFVFFLSLGRFAEMRARHRAGDAVDALVRLVPATAIRLTGTDEERVGIAELEIGDVLMLRPGEPVPVDGEVVEGESSVDESLLSGESMPINKSVGSALVGGSLNLSGALQMRVTGIGQDTVVSRIARMLERAQETRPPVARIADSVAGWFVTAVLVGVTVVGWWWWQHEPAAAFRVVLSVLVVTCPCALSLATPVALATATSALARQGVLVVQGGALETLARATDVVFDKTGTLTEGQLRIERTLATPRCTADQALVLAAALERHSEHPIARAFGGIATPLKAEDVEIQPGQGVSGTVDGTRLRIGRPDYVGTTENAAPSDEPGTWMALGDDEDVLAWFLLSDQPRTGTSEAVSDLRELGLVPHVASGDHAAVVEAVSRELGIDDYRSRLTPEAKLRLIRELQAEGSVVAMVGDGVNDAPVLAGADVSAAMASGTALAQTSAGMILVTDTLGVLPRAVRTARRTRHIIMQNLGWAVLYNVVALPLAATGQVAPWMAAIGMSASSLLVVLNALRLSRGSAGDHET